MGDWESVNAENMVRHAKSGVYYLRAKVGGKIIRRSLGVKALKVAKIKRDEMLIELRSMAVTRSTEVKSLTEALQMALVRSSTKAGQKEETVVYWEKIHKSLKTTLPLTTKPTQLTTDQLRLWWSSFVKQYSATRANNALGMVKMMGDILKETGAQVKNPAGPLKRVPVPQSDIVVLSREELENLLLDVSAQNRRASIESAHFIAFMAFSGLRIGEVRKMKWEYVGELELKVPSGKGRAGKQEFRRVPIIARMRQLLEKMRYDDAKGLIFSITSPRYALENACKRLGYPHQSPHDMRHFFATMCIEQGVEIPTVAKWLGHKDKGVLAMKVYGHLRDEHSLIQASKIV